MVRNKWTAGSIFKSVAQTAEAQGVKGVKWNHIFSSRVKEYRLTHTFVTESLGQNCTLFGIKTKCNCVQKCHILYVQFPNFSTGDSPWTSVEGQAPPFVITPIWPPAPTFKYLPQSMVCRTTAAWYDRCWKILTNQSQVTKFTCNGSIIRIEIGIFFSHKFSSIWAQTQNRAFFHISYSEQPYFPDIWNNFAVHTVCLSCCSLMPLVHVTICSTVILQCYTTQAIHMEQGKMNFIMNIMNRWNITSLWLFVVSLFSCTRLAKKTVTDLHT